MTQKVEELISAVMQFRSQDTGENEFCECTDGHIRMGVVCMSCYVLALAEALQKE